MAWAGIESNRFTVVSGKPRIYRSSPGVSRGFCEKCGTSLTHAATSYPNEVYVAIAAFDDAADLAPGIHIWRSDKLPWFETDDDGPRYVRFQSDGILESVR
jgi:hypothetical protein